MYRIDDYIYDALIDGLKKAIPVQSYILDFISEHYKPNELYTWDQLEEWAENNGFKRENGE